MSIDDVKKKLGRPEVQDESGLLFSLSGGDSVQIGLDENMRSTRFLRTLSLNTIAMTGHAAPYVPGWDCHGLPIELQVEKNIGRAKKLAMSKAEIRRLCKEYAEKYISIQREEFKRLGVLGDWERPYRTLDPDYEAQEFANSVR